MVSSALVDALVSPACVINDIFVNAVTDDRTDNVPLLIRDHFSSLFAGDNVHQIPSIDMYSPPSAYPPMSLVRFRAMIQDTSCSPEMYIASSKNSRCGGWGLDAMEGDTHLNYEALKERDVVWAVSIPGEATWCNPSRTTTSSVSAGAILPTLTRSVRYSRSLEDGSYARPHKFPIPDSPHVALRLKVYDGSAGSLKPTTIHECVGILTSEVVHSDFTAGTSAPTLHVLFHRSLAQTISLSNLPEADIPSVQAVRDDLLSWMASEALGDDRDAAEWVLLSCLSSVESRNPPLLPMAITLSGFTKPTSPSVPSISLVLSEILPLHVHLPLSLKLLNEHSFRPESKDEDLHAGILQVPQDTTITITETRMTEGTLGERGIENMKALQEIVKLQTLQYKFPFSQYSFATDIKCIALTDGQKSLFLDSVINIPLRPDTSANLYKGRETIKWPSPEKVSAFRDLIIRAKSAKVSVEEELAEHIKTEFVQERQRNTSFTADDLARRMTIARLLSLSRLERRMTLDCWNAAKALDDRRRSRCT